MNRKRWIILGLLFFATTVNYLDRIVFSVLIPVIRQDLHLNDLQYGYINGAFQAAYTLGFLFMGKFIDRVGTRAGYLVSILWWSVAAALHAVARSGVALGFWRFMLGLGEAGNFPSAIKSVAEWFPKKDRAFATGIFNAGTNVAATIGPPAIVAVAGAFGWRAAFLITAGLGLFWVPLWWYYYERPPQQEEDAGEAVGWLEALRQRPTWGFAVGKFLTDPVWWFYLIWLPPYFYDARHFNLKEIGWALPVIYLAADVGSVGGGWLSGYLMRRGWEVLRARKTAMLAAAACMPVAVTAVFVKSPILAIALVALATSAHQGWSANLFTTASDAFPSNTVASVVGIGASAGGLGGFLFSAIVPGVLITYFGYVPVFILMGVLHPLALVCVHLLMGKPEAYPT
ncbi:MAG: MFS transporter [Acidobacteria bacterium]|nr:MFS transporter [Acidobacteriota bacterium]